MGKETSWYCLNLASALPKEASLVESGNESESELLRAPPTDCSSHTQQQKVPLGYPNGDTASS